MKISGTELTAGSMSTTVVVLIIFLKSFAQRLSLQGTTSGLLLKRKYNKGPHCPALRKQM
jgi:hypothetical protein